MKDIYDLTIEEINVIRRDVANRIRANEGAEYNQGHFIQYKEANWEYPLSWENIPTLIESYQNCGTACCIAGHTFMSCATKVSQINELFEHRHITISTLSAYARMLLGLSSQEGAKLFAGWMNCLTHEEMREYFKSDEEKKKLDIENALRVARILDQLADGVEFDEAFRNRTKPMNLLPL